MFDTYYWEVLMYPRFLIFERSTLRHPNLLPVYCNSSPIWSFLTQFLAPPQMALNLKQNHISQVEWAILDAFHYHTPGSLYDKIRKSVFWGIMHDHISKIWKIFFWIYLHGINEHNDPFDVLYCLSKMKVGVDSFYLGENFYFVSFSKLACFFNAK